MRRAAPPCERQRLLFEATDCMGPIVLFQGLPEGSRFVWAAEVAAAYSDGRSSEVSVKAASGTSARTLHVARIPRDALKVTHV
jgi:hypothetical protein